MAAHHRPTRDQHRVDRSAGFGEHELPRSAVERHEGGLGEIEEHQVGRHSGFERADPALHVDGLGAGQGRSLERVRRGDPVRLRTGDGGKQTQHPHGDEDVLGLGATVVVAAQRHLDARLVQVKDRRSSALQLEIADRVMHDAGARRSQHLDVARGQPDAMHQVEPLIQQPGILKERKQRNRLHLCGRRLRARLVDMGEYRQLVVARQLGDAREQFRRAALRRRGRQRPSDQRPGRHAEALDLARDEIKLLLGAAASAAEDTGADRLRQVLGHQGRDIELRSVARRDGEVDPDAGLVIGREHGVDERLVGWIDREEVLHRRDAIAQHLGRADQRADADLAMAAGTVTGRTGIACPDVEGRLLEHALHQNIV